MAKKTRDDEEQSGLDRRNFLHLTVGVGALAFGASAGGSLAGGQPRPGAVAPRKSISLTGRIPTRPFGKTGYELPVLGHGGSAMVESWAAGYGVTLESREARAQMVRRGYEAGIRYFDTARVYGESESIMGKALEDVRNDVFIASKVADPRPEKTRESVETSLTELRTDYVDLMQIHSPAIERVGYDGAMKIYEQLARLREEGMVHFIGLTTHVAFEEVYRLIDTGLFDQTLLARGYIRKGMDMMLSNANREWSARCVARAAELDMAVVAMKVMGLNLMGRGSARVVEFDESRRTKVPSAAIRWVLQDQRVSMLNIGMSVPDDIDANVATLRGDLALTEDDRSLLAEYGARVYDSAYVKSLRVV